MIIILNAVPAKINFQHALSRDRDPAEPVEYATTHAPGSAGPPITVPLRRGFGLAPVKTTLLCDRSEVENGSQAQALV